MLLVVWANNMSEMFHHSFVALVFNFIDFLVHQRSESDILMEIAPDSAGFRSLTRAWFKHSALLSMLKQIAEKKITVYITTDHGSITAKKTDNCTWKQEYIYKYQI